MSVVAVDADVGEDQRLLEVVPGLAVDLLAGQDRAHVAGQRAAGLAQPVAEPWPDRRGGLDRGLCRRLDRGLGDLGGRRLDRRRCGRFEGGLATAAGDDEAGTGQHDEDDQGDEQEFHGVEQRRGCRPAPGSRRSWCSELSTATRRRAVPRSR